MSTPTLDGSAGTRTRVVLIDDAPRGQVLRSRLQDGGLEVVLVSAAEAGWRTLAQLRPEVVVVSLGLAAAGAHGLLKRLHEESPGTRPHVVGIGAAGTAPEPPMTRWLDALVLDGDPAGALLDAIQAVAAVDASPPSSEVLARLLAITTLAGDPDGARRALVKLLCEGVNARACFLYLLRRDACWSYGAGELTTEQRAELLRRALQATRLETAVVHAPLLSAEGAAAPASESYYALHATMEHREVGVLVCFVNHLRHAPPSLGWRAIVAAQIRRLRNELSWLSVHQRLTTELDAARESGGLDPLLGIWNRASLGRLLVMMEASSRRTGAVVVVAVIDVKNMAEINERHGHAEGDAVLKHVAKIAVYMLRVYDVVARYGGDEIAIVFSGTTLEDGVKVLQRLIQTIESRPYETTRAARLQLTVSAGISALTGSEDSTERALARAAAGRQTALDKGLSVQVVSERGPARPASAGADQLTLEGVTLHGVYRILHQIGAGGGGGVYRAEDLSLRRSVAVKVLNPDLARKEALVERFREEASILASLRHNNLVQVYAFGVENAYVYFAMELVEGESLRQAVERCKKERLWFSFQRVIQVVEQIASALAMLHRSGIIHRDVKPANVLMDPFRSRAVLVDVGIALQSQDEGWLAGTPGYMAPEAAHTLTRDTSVDVYGLAVTIYEVLTLQLPWPETPDPMAMLRAQVERAAIPPSRWRAELAPLDAVLLRAVEVAPQARWTDVSQFGAALCEALHSIAHRPSVGGSGPASAPSAPSSRGHRSSAVMAAFAPTPDTRRGASPSGELHSAAPQRSIEMAPTMTWDAGMAEDQPATRGVVFRSVPRVIGARNVMKWRMDLAQRHGHLLEALRPSSPPLAWLPTAWLVALLSTELPDERQPGELGRALGRAVVRATFRRFFPASSATLSPASTLQALPQIWREYHTWGVPQALAVRAESAVIRVQGTVGSNALSALTCGMLEGLVMLSGGSDPIVAESHSEARGDDACVYQCKWQWSPHPSRSWRTS